MEKIVFDLDTSKCTACAACALACMDQNDIDSAHGQHAFRNILAFEHPVREDGVHHAYYSIACMHCEDAPCVMACPCGCLYKDAETGLTLFNNENCIGCHSCALACPFGAPSFDGKGKMVKCDGCVARLRAGLTPACVRVCPSGALRCRTEAEPDEIDEAHSLRKLAQEQLQKTQ